MAMKLDELTIQDFESFCKVLDVIRDVTPYCSIEVKNNNTMVYLKSKGVEHMLMLSPVDKLVNENILQFTADDIPSLIKELHDDVRSTTI